jgi:hypothetical protein
MDPNGLYLTDKIKSAFGEVITLGKATDYKINIRWKDKSVRNANGKGNTGWLK